MNLIQIINFILMLFNISLAFYILYWKNYRLELKDSQIKDLKKENELLRKDLYENYGNEQKVAEDFAHYISEKTSLVFTKYDIADFFERRRKNA